MAVPITDGLSVRFFLGPPIPPLDLRTQVPATVPVASPRLNESATTALKPDERGLKSGPGRRRPKLPREARLRGGCPLVGKAGPDSPGDVGRLARRAAEAARWGLEPPDSVVGYRGLAVGVLEKRAPNRELVGLGGARW